MNFRNIGVIISREYATRVRKKSFLAITFIVPVLFALLCTLPTLIILMSKEKDKTVEVVDRSGIVMPYLTDNDALSFIDCSASDLDSLKKGISSDGADAILYISPVDTAARTVSVDMFSLKPVSVDVKESIVVMVETAVEDYRLAAYKIDGLRQIMDDVKADISVATYTVGEDGQDKITSSEVYMFVSIALTLVIYMFIAMFSGMVMTSVIEEKSSKVAEVLVSSVKATELMFGKIIGVACVALTQFFLWIVLAVVIVAAVNATIGFDAIAGDPQQAMQIAQMSGMDMSMVDTMTSGSGSEMTAIIETLKDLDYIQLIVSFVVYFLLGYLLYASLFAAIGSAVDNEGDSTQLQLPVTVPLLLAFFIAFYAFEAPDSQLAFWGSIIPFTSPIVMLARLPFGVPVWELGLSIGLLLLTFVALAYVSARIYRVGLLVSGKKTTFSDLWKWLKQK
ncbi:MAG: ABC transporter permease [Bacteroidetes bacterium]|uniref:ABC transporter permease n=1 Tax=Candidatus Cryptobacteroides faecigallinarum TaxID=2840763 RepID=A0A9D9ILT7_9BACT|nr:ABC transporter permease [Candidatus Cryptobacteroides faecigallinarum]